MQQNQYKKIVWLWLFALWCSTTGWAVESIYCFCSGKTRTALAIFHQETGCEHQIAATSSGSCCQKSASKISIEPVGFSVKTKNTSPARHQIDDVSKECCKNTGIRFFKLSEDFENQFKTSQKVDFQKVIAIFQQKWRWQIAPKVAHQPIVFELAEPPPAPSGRMIRVRLQSFLC